MERSEGHDAWGDLGDGAPHSSDDRSNDAGTYPVAPLPAHERTWRHPSEVGRASWTLSEPPLAIGRGLLVTTGAIGGVLGIAVLWLLVPVGGGLAPSASATATSSLISRVLTPSTQPDLTELLADPTTILTSAVPTSPPSTVSVTHAPAPVNTVMVQARRAVESPRSIAVAIDDAPYMVTTAAAVSGTDGVNLFGTDDATVDSPDDPIAGSVVAIEGDLAYIEPSGDIEVVGFAEVASAEVGQMVTVLSEGGELAVPYTGAGDVAELDASIIVEGTPVIDDSGALVALCTVTIDGEVDGKEATVRLVPIGLVDGPTDTVAPDASATSSTAPSTTAPATPAAWVGVRLGGLDGVDQLTVTSVAAGSPAELAGLQVGDRIVAVDGLPVATVDDVVVLLAAKVPGDTAAITVASAGSTAGATPGGTERTVSVVLGAYEPTV